MGKLTGNRVMSGTWGEVWLDNEYVAEVRSFQAKVNFNKDDINFCGQLATDSKIISTKGTGSVGMHKVSSRMANKIGNNIKKGIDTRVTIISKLSDPDAFGAERVVVRNVAFDDLTLADWEVAVNGKVEVPFTFTEFEFLDQVGDR